MECPSLSKTRRGRVAPITKTDRPVAKDVKAIAGQPFARQISEEIIHPHESMQQLWAAMEDSPMNISRKQLLHSTELMIKGVWY